MEGFLRNGKKVVPKARAGDSRLHPWHRRKTAMVRRFYFAVALLIRDIDAALRRHPALKFLSRRACLAIYTQDATSHLPRHIVQN